MTRLLRTLEIAAYLLLAIEIPLRIAFYQVDGQLTLFPFLNLSSPKVSSFQLPLLESIFTVGLIVLIIYRLPKLKRVLRMLDGHYAINPIIMKAGICGAGIILLSHWVACGWLALGSHALDEPTAMRAYIRSLYWAVTSLTTVGYGDIVPRTTVEYSYAIGVMLLGVGMYAFIIGTIASLISERDHVRAAHRERLNKLRSYLSYHGVPSNLKRRIWTYYNYLWESGLGDDEFQTLSEIPEPLRSEVAEYIVGDLLKAAPIFQDASSALIRHLAPKLKPRLSMPNDLVVREGSPGYEMYFINSGQVEVYRGQAEGPMEVLTAGDHFGELALLNEASLRTANVRAKSVVELFALDRSSFLDALELFPDFAERMQKIANLRSK